MWNAVLISECGKMHGGTSQLQGQYRWEAKLVTDFEKADRVLRALAGSNPVGLPEKIVDSRVSFAQVPERVEFSNTALQ